ncbi:MAG: nuclease-related domain-containing protein [Vicinamibacterales bacterium]
MTSRSGKKRSPLRHGPLRNPGQSIEERIEEVATDRLLLPLVGALFLCAVAALEWWRLVTDSPPQPVVVTVLALIAIAFVARRFVVVWREIKMLRLGLEGEKAVAQYLEANRRDGWRLLNDVPGTGFNVDHVLVTPRGVFAIETKTISKPSRGESKVVFDGEQVLVNGLVPDRDPVVQARASRDWIRSILEDTTGKRFPVKAVVLYPGWYVTRTNDRRSNEVWVLNEKALPAFIARRSLDRT